MSRRIRKAAGPIVARYDYVDKRGKLLSQVRRHDPKGFAVRSAAVKRLTQGGRYRHAQAGPAPRLFKVA